MHTGHASKRLLTGWGATSPSAATVLPAGTDAELSGLLATAGPRGVIARGLGRSYGDAAQNSGGVVVDMTTRNRVLSVDTQTALVEVEAGASLDQLMRLLLPLGLFVPVTPGTRQVTVGGAIAADIHGKNHHVDGSLGRHILSLDLLVADGTIHHLTPESPVFWATVGGMGLTGLIVRATLRMKRVESAYCVVDTERCTNVDDLLERMAATDDRYTYSVAWIDCLAHGLSLGRSVLTRGSSAPLEQLPAQLRDHALDFRPRQLATAPPVFPSGLLNRATVAVFNEAWYHKAPRERRGEIQSIAAFFHPLDGVARWNRIYGPRGFLQYQFVVPFGAEETLRRCLEMLSHAGQASFLAVLKRFGPAGRGHLSFPVPGWTLALDIPVGAPILNRLLNRLDEEVMAAGGRHYLAKDSRLPADAIAQMYPRLDEWRAIVRNTNPDRVFTSDLARRLEL
ncbi:decaprenylphospho-beta-D-ribofuranose 2-oxidase [Sanguibacter gelidistatuariae]|uniref:Decaprenylphospho-beta-D-ribofuranose 2-oxidase n=1 Tax=Sanguibacter gelidistatuariae TaxID=1814289 RepID=A0A1G6XIR6_9MICO|nr:FAD-binding oxidoreductase [Sanguibacter gelidistatuariae]SDD78089.1 decaprenylphospho-beta-D-ribofuranose 2-oxidase [Sanguibacter gelidistatuariae]